ncbi:Lecithin:cholesterol acyltransferase [Cruoricaptor ignavus]|uniref:Lecithin:cholesterol acyltransferase n=1 Tax=Cruoricaptor ignavus TaxID=1118202 RepID=A0A1M6HU47_9FLAO|nr:hypothetical protein [Cruoricaptor ignavus]SHJ25762.1 Lecithin:cholesterol acyltransferase [Cruoricaptor ignavus]
MKTKLLSALAIIFSLYANAQTNLYSTQNQALPENAVLEENTLQNIFNNLDKSKIETGLLLDAAVEFVDLKKYNGIPTDSSYTSSKIIGDIYNTIVMSKVSANQGTLKPPADFQSEWFKAQATDLLPVGGVYYRYNQFSESNNAYFQATAKTASATGRIANISTSTLTVSPNNVVTDVYTNRVWQNPYEISDVFAMAPIANSHNKLNFNVVFAQSLFQSNYDNEISKLEVKFSDNEAFKTVNYGQLMNVYYPAIGEYIWTYKLTLNNGQVLYSKNKFLITGDLGKYVNEDATATSRVSAPYKKIELEKFQYFIPFPPMVVNRPKLTLYIKYRSGQTQITKPFIVAEGFDAGHITAPRQEGGDNNIDDFLNGKGMKNSELQSYLIENYDIIYVDWGIGTDYIQNNAELLKKAIRWVNQNKVGTEKNIVMGQSMGGLVARYALKDMEDKGENHDTKLYISHDAPHLGANTPLGIQYMLRNVSKTFLKSPVVAGINYILSPVVFGVPISEVLTVADTPASRQMLINYVDKNYNIDNSVHNSWQSTLKTKGYPQQTRNVAISNGSECGTDQNLQDLVTMHHVSKGWFIDFIGALIGGVTLDPGQVILSILPGKSRYHYDFVVRPMTNLNENKELYNGKIVYKKDILWFIPSQNTLLSGSNYQPQGILPIDKYGGGKYRFPKNSLPRFIGDYLTVSYFSFVPTPSALDYKFGNQSLIESDYQKTFSPFDDLQNTPFVNFVAEKVDDYSANNNHIFFSQRNGQFIINQLSTDTAIQNQKITTAYLCGSKIQIGGDAVLCGNNNSTYTTSFAPYISWSVISGANLIDITSTTNQPQISFTPKAGASGFVKLQAYLYGDGSSNTVTKNIWIGKPHVSVTQINNPDYYNQSHFNLDLPASTSELGITQIKWTKLSSTDPTARLYAPLNATSGSAKGYDNSWTMQVKVEITNACGTTEDIVTILPPPFAGCDGYNVGKSGKGNTAYIIIDPCATNRTLSTESNNKLSNIKTEVSDIRGNVIISTSNLEFDISNQLPGTYYLRIIKNNKIVHSQTLLKN